MATLKQRLHRKDNNGEYDTVHLETSADLVLLPDGTTVADSVNILSSEITNIPEYIPPYTAGDIFSWEGYTWRIVHICCGYMVMITDTILSKISYGSSETTYAGSRLAALALEMENTLSNEALSRLMPVTVSGVTAKVFIPSAVQCGYYPDSNPACFDWFKASDNRKAYYNGNHTAWWTSTNQRFNTGSDSTTIYPLYVNNNDNSTITHTSRGSGAGFRPCVAYKF